VNGDGACAKLFAALCAVLFVVVEQALQAGRVDLAELRI
jgi:hypothetical protein